MLNRVFPANSSVVAEVRPSPNHDERAGGRKPDMIVLHYTGMPDAEAALDRLCDPLSKVSAHYLVFEDGRVVQMVQESRRAWHAGQSFWAGETDLNSCSIGIEIVNPGHDYELSGFSQTPDRCRNRAMPRHLDPQYHPAAARAGALRHRAVPQAGSGREVSVAHAVRFRHWTLGPACSNLRG